MIWWRGDTFKFGADADGIAIFKYKDSAKINKFLREAHRIAVEIKRVEIKEIKP